MFRAHIREMLHAGRYIASGSRVLDYERQVHRVGLRAGRFVEAGPQAGMFV